MFVYRDLGARKRGWITHPLSIRSFVLGVECLARAATLFSARQRYAAVLSKRWPYLEVLFGFFTRPFPMGEIVKLSKTSF